MLNHPILPYAAPFALFLGLAVSLPEDPSIYPWAYMAAIAFTGVFTLYLHRKHDLFSIHGDILPGLLFGAVGIVLWIGLAELQLEQALTPYLPEWLQPKARVAFDPFTSISSTPLLWGFLAIRFLGIALLVPIVEEVFWRGFLWRWIGGNNWKQEPMGQFSWGSFLWVTGLFTLAHPEWFSAIAWCVLINLLFVWKKDLWNCIVAHCVSNALLFAYVLTTKSWTLW